MTNDELIAQADAISADVNQLASARTFAREAAAALGENEKYIRGVQADALFELTSELRLRKEDLGAASKREYLNVQRMAELEHQLQEQSEARERLTRLIGEAQWLIVNAETHFRPDVSRPVRDDFRQAAARLLAILNPTPNVQENARDGDSGVSQEVV